jgi:hypothetical protein
MAVYDKPNRRLQLAATVAAELAPTPDSPSATGAVGEIFHRGGEI